MRYETKVEAHVLRKEEYKTTVPYKSWDFEKEERDCEFVERVKRSARAEGAKMVTPLHIFGEAIRSEGMARLFPGDEEAIEQINIRLVEDLDKDVQAWRGDLVFPTRTKLIMEQAKRRAQSVGHSVLEPTAVDFLMAALIEANKEGSKVFEIMDDLEINYVDIVRAAERFGL